VRRQARGFSVAISGRAINADKEFLAKPNLLIVLYYSVKKQSLIVDCWCDAFYVRWHAK
jgi:hypothetical protein